MTLHCCQARRDMPVATERSWRAQKAASQHSRQPDSCQRSVVRGTRQVVAAG